MRVFLFRHAEAQPQGSVPDFERPLTPAGTERTRRAARALSALQLAPVRLLSSPLLRARQTAAILSEALRTPVEISSLLGYDFSAAALRELLRELPADADVLLVGHEPTFSAVVRDLTGADVDFKRGGMARIDLLAGDADRGILVWMIAPRLFDLMDPRA